MSTTSTPSPRWWTYTISFLASGLIAVDCAINALYFMHGHYTLVVMLGAAISGAVLNWVLYATDGPAELQGLVSGVKNLFRRHQDGRRPWPALNHHAVANVLALASGAVMGAFTLQSYLGLMAKGLPIPLPLAVAFSLAYAVGTYVILRVPFAGLCQALSPQALRARFQQTPSQRWAMLRNPTLVVQIVLVAAAWLATFLTAEQWLQGMQGLLTHTLHLPGPLAVALAWVGLVAILLGELAFSSRAAQWFSTWFERPPASTVRADEVGPSPAPAASVRAEPHVWQRTKAALKARPLTTLVLGSLALTLVAWNALGNGAIAGGNGVLSHALGQPIAIAVGVGLSVMVMSKACYELANAQHNVITQLIGQPGPQRRRVLCSVGWALLGSVGAYGGYLGVQGHPLASFGLQSPATVGIAWCVMVVIASVGLYYALWPSNSEAKSALTTLPRAASGGHHVPGKVPGQVVPGQATTPAPEDLKKPPHDPNARAAEPPSHCST